MGKLLFWLVVGVVAWFGWQAFRRAQRAVLAREAAERQQVERSRLPQPMVRCEHCGVHLPETEAVSEAGRHWCSVAHRDADRP